MNRVGLSLLLLLIPGIGLAASLPLGVTVAAVAVTDLSGTLCSQGNPTYASCSVSGSTAVADVTNGTGGLASVTLGSTATGGAAITEYYLYLQGPSNVQVPIVISGMATTADSGTLYGLSYAAYYIYQDATQGLSFVGQYFASPTSCLILSSIANCMSAGSFSLNATVSSNTVFFVFFEAVAGGVNASALIDPLVSVDPTFAQADQFSVVANPGVFASSPEPADAGLTAAALLGFAILARQKARQRRHVAVDGI